MIQRLDYRDGTSALFERGTDLLEKAESMIDAGRFLLNCIRGPFVLPRSSHGLEKILERAETSA